jgi:Superinfection immunity protein/Protein of unknown function (DUF2510)
VTLPTPYTGTPPAPATDKRPVWTGTVIIGWTLAVITIGYLIPLAVAMTRGKSNVGGVAIVNIFLGWTFIGWAVALVMACTAHHLVPQVQVTAMLPAAPGWYPVQGGQRYWDGRAWTDHTA